MDIRSSEIYEVYFARGFRLRMDEEGILHRFATVNHHVSHAEGRVIQGYQPALLDHKLAAFVQRDDYVLVRGGGHQWHVQDDFVVGVDFQPVVLEHAAFAYPSHGEAQVVELSAQVEDGMGHGVVIEEIGARLEDEPLPESHASHREGDVL